MGDENTHAHWTTTQRRVASSSKPLLSHTPSRCELRGALPWSLPHFLSNHRRGILGQRVASPAPWRREGGVAVSKSWVDGSCDPPLIPTRDDTVLNLEPCRRRPGLADLLIVLADLFTTRSDKMLLNLELVRKIANRETLFRTRRGRRKKKVMPRGIQSASQPNPNRDERKQGFQI